MAGALSNQRTAPRPLWYKDAIVYQLHVRSFFDTDGDGIGDFRGLTSKLDYVQDLGVTAIWLLPFYPSPLRDEGYDIADYTTVNPAYGTLDDFREFLDEAHRRELQVISELVINHTSDQHAWFQAARRAKPGEPARDFYVWSDDPKRYRDARVIFQDFETSNWSWDPVAKAYFWHRFYSHQPDLNYDNPAVHDAIFQLVDFWLGLGVDGLRLDAVPYLYEREGTNCENLPETHEFLRRLRRHVDERHPNRLLLAEANQWPEDAAAYFGAGDECHMNFNFPLMPRLFMAVHHEDSYPVIDIVRQTPSIPENCQWGIFLRNHDELTLEMVTDEERDRMYRAYADDPRARVNLGIRRRLAPLLKNNRRKLELMNALLMALPGTPIMYYGDEIEMGDNIYLPDRDSVRTPMQWSPDRNAGFSNANPQRLFLPPIIDPEYHFATRNVETQVNSPHSLLWWMRRLVRLRRRHPAFARGTIEFLPCENPKILAFLREYDGETILAVANLSRFVQCVELDLARFRGRAPIELFGKTPFPLIGELPYFLTLGPHGFIWFGLEWPSGEETRYEPLELPVLEAERDWAEALETADGRRALAAMLPAFFRRHRWFAGKARTIHETEIVDWSSFVAKDEAATRFHLLVVRVAYTDGDPDIYLAPVFYATGKRVEGLLADHPAAGVCRVDLAALEQQGFLCDAAMEREMWLALLEMIAAEGALAGNGGQIVGRAISAGAALEQPPELLEPIVHRRQQSNSSAHFDEKFILKLFRRLADGENPELELGRHLLSADPPAPAPPLAGWLEYRAAKQHRHTLAVLQAFQPNQGDAWTYTLDEIGRFCERVATEYFDVDPLVDLPSSRHPCEMATREAPPLVHEILGGYLSSAELLGKRAAELHVALASDAANPAFAAEAFNKLYQRGLYQSLRTASARSLQLLKRQVPSLPGDLAEIARQVLAREQPYLDCFHWLVNAAIQGKRIRCHGDLHLGQVLFTGNDFSIIDFEGEPDRPVSERRIKRSPLRDVAGMLRSFYYASQADRLGLVPGLGAAGAAHDTTPALRQWMDFWYTWTTGAFVRGYLQGVEATDLLAADPAETRALLDIFLLEKLMYELSYELNSRPNWAGIPIRGLHDFAQCGD